ncbi:hypothetical protein ATANTOWER_019694 [Ataeniobius toweri]|uniref:Uncharacterized protein n=1 Tax=Ataeniobius toweri TaxID=208326 RepID=A0ABU7B1A4_9TELE|nr:hypothetical protein [Ataeniobius toweri]
MLSRAAKFEEMSTVFKRLATANLLSARYRNHGDAAPVVLLSGRENRFTRLVETVSLLGTSLGQFASAGLRENQRDISALVSSYPDDHRRGRDQTIGNGVLLCSQWHHGKSAATVCLAVPEEG